MSVKRKISYNVYEIYPFSFPDKIKIKVYRGDVFSLTLIGFNEADDSPFDFGSYDPETNFFSASIKLGKDYDDLGESYTFTSNEFVLGKTDIANSEFDELHIVSKNALNFNLTESYTKAWFDVERTFNGERQTLIKALLVIELDITK